MTGRAVGYLILLGIAYLAAALLSLELLVCLVIALVLLPLFSALQLLLFGRAISVSQRLDPPVIERGTPAVLHVRLNAGRWFSHGRVDLILQKTAQDGHLDIQRHSVPLMAGSQAEIAFPLQNPHRGLYPVGLRRVISRDLLGLFFLPVKSRRQCLVNLQEIAVLPKPSPIGGLAAITAELTGLASLQNVKPGDEVNDLANLRQQRPGESMKRVHWKISARLDEMMVKEFDNPSLQTGLLLLDMARPVSGAASAKSGLLEFADFFTDHAADLARQFIQNRIPLSYVCFQPDGRQELLVESDDDDLLVRLLLAGLAWTDIWPAAAALREETLPPAHHWFVLLLTSRLDGDTVQQLIRLREIGRPVYLVLLLDQLDRHSATAQYLHELANNQIPVIVHERQPSWPVAAGGQAAGEEVAGQKHEPA